MANKIIQRYCRVDAMLGSIDWMIELESPSERSAWTVCGDRQDDFCWSLTERLEVVALILNTTKQEKHSQRQGLRCKFWLFLRLNMSLKAFIQVFHLDCSILNEFIVAFPWQKVMNMYTKIFLKSCFYPLKHRLARHRLFSVTQIRH